MPYIIQYHDPDLQDQCVSWNNRQYADYRDAAVAAIEAKDRHHGPGRSWTVSRIERLKTFR